MCPLHARARRCRSARHVGCRSEQDGEHEKRKSGNRSTLSALDALLGIDEEEDKRKAKEAEVRCPMQLGSVTAGPGWPSCHEPNVCTGACVLHHVAGM
jgi:hypothetical protein